MNSSDSSLGLPLRLRVKPFSWNNNMDEVPGCTSYFANGSVSLRLSCGNGLTIYPSLGLQRFPERTERFQPFFLHFFGSTIQYELVNTRIERALAQIPAPTSFFALPIECLLGRNLDCQWHGV